MADADLRQLEREAGQGNPYAIKKLVYAQLRSGQPLYHNFFMRLSKRVPYTHMAFPLTHHFSGRFIPDMDELVFFEHFQVQGYEGELILARSVMNQMPESITDLPPLFLNNLNDYEIAELPEMFEQGYHIVEDILPLETIYLNQLVMPPTYDKRHIPEYEDEPEYPSKEVIVALKNPGEEVKFFHVKSDTQFIERLLKETHVTSLHLKWAEEGLRMFVAADLLDNHQPNFILKIPANVHPSAKERILKMIEEGTADGRVAEFLQDRFELIHGPALFTKMILPDFDSIDWNLLPWPWNELGREDPDKDWPASEEYLTLGDHHIDLLEELTLPIPFQIPVPATHFVVENSGAIIFEIEPCDKCGKDALAANSVRVFATSKELKNVGLSQLESLPSELGWSEEFGGAVCENCY